ncbi:hypothetical protein [Gimesia algae]|uniref:Uncharacterized protein n=1 Tax=Gimesia algae TaxID=2527971 RepID=A0A517VE82_9PLAN|nr:hypothetical protein [Gimesia algae]QDT91321.1 hypothetical protein Pan161_29780 [Gimesia algae]
MSWLKSLNYKRFLQLFSKSSTASEPRFLFRWNQTTKVFAGLLASLFSMMALLSFFGSLEGSEEDQRPELLSPVLGTSDELSMEFGLDAELPLQGPAFAEPDAKNPVQQDSLIQTVSVDRAPSAGADQAAVLHAVGQTSENTNGHIQQVAGDHPIYVTPRRSAGIQSVVQENEAVWLTGEIESLE